MGNLFRAFLFKLRRDLTFRITLIVGLGIAVLMTLIYLAIDLGMTYLSDSSNTEMIHAFCTGENLLVSSLNPAQNFGIAIPVNLITFTVLEFSNGTIRNKIIAGNSKVKVYLGLYFSGLIFTLVILGTYALLCFGLGSAIGSYHPHGILYSALSGAQISHRFMWQLLVLYLLGYVTIVTVTIFFATLFRHIGPCIPIVILLLMACYISATIFNTIAILGMGDDSTSKIFVALGYILKVINPLFSCFSFDTEMVIISEYEYYAWAVIPWDAFWIQIANNIVYIGLFLGFGILIFKKRDIK